MSGQPRILVVDYDPKILGSLQDILIENGYAVETAKDGIAALALYRDYRPDLVLLEAMIPKKHGFEVCQEIKKDPEGKSIPVIITTSVYKGRKYRSQAMHVHGCDEYVEKPCTPEALLEIVKRFVPPAKMARAAAMGRTGPAGPGASQERRGEVIPFPGSRGGGYAPHEADDDTEREIMSKLDEIMPDTPMFNERGLSAPALAPDGDGGAELLDPEIESKPVPAGPAALPSRTASAPSKPPKDSGRGQPAKPRKGPPAAMKADEVMKMTRSKRRPQNKPKEEPAPTKRLISPIYIVGLIVAVVIVVISLLLGRV
jgi:CheY-like chemotaxis protein